MLDKIFYFVNEIYFFVIDEALYLLLLGFFIENGLKNLTIYRIGIK